MTISIDKESVLAALSGENPCGEYLYYSATYDEIKKARRADDPAFARDGDDKPKESEWQKVITLCVSTLSEKSKDLQIAAWLSEALTIKEGFQGLAIGMEILEGLVNRYWENVYPLVEDDDYDGRAAPFEFLNEKISLCVRHIPLTDPRTTPGFGLFKWKESRDVGYESDAKRNLREELLSEGKISAEQFDISITKSSVAFYKSLGETISNCLESFKSLELAVDAKFGAHSPRLSDLGQTIEECHRLVFKIGRDQKGLKEVSEESTDTDETARQLSTENVSDFGGETTTNTPVAASSQNFAMPLNSSSADLQETQIWSEALRILQNGGFKKALELLLSAATSQASERGRCRYRFLVAKLCLKAGQPELARPIIEQLNTMVIDLQLEKWESPFWISEILEALYQCLTTGEDADDEAGRAKELFKKICTMDVTKALK
ncbi:MAG: type VI secretion system protein TssA [Desulfuromonadaceae bacterium]